MLERVGLLAVALVVVVAMVATTLADGPATIEPDAAAVQPTPAAVDERGSPSPTPTPTRSGEPASWVVTGPDGAAFRTEADGVVDEVAASGLTWPIIDEVDGGYVVDTHCDRRGWVAAADVERPTVVRGGGLAGAVVVLDPGHGGIDTGAVGPDGTLESDLNLAVAERLRDLLQRGNTVEESGSVTAGDQHPPVSTVLMTRDLESGQRGEQRTSLSFRGRLATIAGADALLSIHHNAGDSDTFDEPPSEVYYSVDDQPSRRLAGLVIEELRRSLAPLAEQWRGKTTAGTIGRRDRDGTDYYTLLETGEVPAVITEGLYLSDPAMEDLARTEEFQRAYAEALYRALVRFLDTDETGDEVNEATEFRPAGESEPYDFSDCSLAAPVDADTDADTGDETTGDGT